MTPKTRHLERRGRTIVLTTLGLFVVAQIIGGLLLDYCWPQLRNPWAWSRFWALERDMKAMGGSPTLAYFGSSRIKSDLNAAVLSAQLQHLTGRQDFWAFDGALPSADGTVMEFAYRELFQRGLRPECIVLEVVPETLNAHQGYIGEHVLWTLRWEDIPPYFREICQTGNLPRLAKARLVPLYTYRQEIVKLCQSQIPWLAPSIQATAEDRRDRAPRGVFRTASRQAPERSPKFTPPNEDVEAASVQVAAKGDDLGRIRRRLHNYQAGGRPCEALERLLVHCREQGCQVILLGVPVASRHRALYTPAIDANYRAYLDHLQKTYGCRFVDCHARVPDHLFSDHHHARPAGGLYFTRLLAEEVLQYVWSKQVVSNHESVSRNPPSAPCFLTCVSDSREGK
jgi:hypothetical protein